MSVASRKAFLNDLRADYDAAIADSLSLPTQYPNAPFTVPAATQWADYFVLLGDEAQIDRGGTTRRFRITGLLQVTIRTPLRVGEDAGMQVAEAIADRYSATTRAGATFQNASVTALGPIGGWYSHAVRCAFYADRFR